MASNLTLLVFCRAPNLGKCKTRLIPALGHDGALAAHCELAEDTLCRLANSDWHTKLCLSEPSSLGVVWANRYGYEHTVQSSGDLGQRMEHAIRLELKERSGLVCLVGIDCPTIDRTYVAQAFAALLENDVVLGPAEDGGYGLIALRAPQPKLFNEIPWGTAQTLEATLNAAKQASLDATLLDKIWDVDDADDWQRYQTHKLSLS